MLQGDRHLFLLPGPWKTVDTDLEPFRLCAGYPGGRGLKSLMEEVTKDYTLLYLQLWRLDASSRHRSLRLKNTWKIPNRLTHDPHILIHKTTTSICLPIRSLFILSFKLPLRKIKLGWPRPSNSLHMLVRSSNIIHVPSVVKSLMA